LEAIAEATAGATAAEAVVVRVLAEGGRWLEARAVSASSTSVAAELQGSRAAPFEDGDAVVLQRAPAWIRRRAHAADRTRGPRARPLELFRHAQSFTTEQETLGRLAAEHAAIALGGPGGNGKGVSPLPALDLLRLGGDALATGLDVQRTADEIARLAAQGSGAEGAVVWRLGDDLQPYVGGTFGTDGQDEREVMDALAARAPFAVTSNSWVLLLGQPPLGALQLRFEQPLVPSDDVLDALTTFAARAAHALRSSERAHRQAVELDRSRALVAVVGQAIAQLSLAHTLETAIDRIAELVGADRLAVYLLEPDEDRLFEAAGRGLAGPHTRVAERMIELARGPLRGREAMLIDDARSDLRLASVREQLAETGIEAAVGLPLRVREDLIGLLAVYPPSGRTLTPTSSRW
jgi:hypothetical protein